MKEKFSSLIMDQKENHDVFINNIKLSMNKNSEKSSILYAKQAMLTPHGLKMSIINGQIYENDKNIDIMAQDAFWPFNQKVIYFFNDFSIGDDELSMSTSTLSYNFEENMCFSHTDEDINYTLKAYQEVLELLKTTLSENNITASLKGKPVEAVFRKLTDKK
jgi:hypothetical protein